MDEDVHATPVLDITDVRRLAAAGGLDLAADRAESAEPVEADSAPELSGALWTSLFEALSAAAQPASAELGASVVCVSWKFGAGAAV